MAKETFMLVSLRDDQAKELAQVISSDTCRKILDYLSKKSATETKLSKELGMPISTIHYNLKHLMQAKLIKADEFHYSQKGKEVNHYSLSNKIVIIAPDATEKLRDKLKKILPVAGIILAATALIQFLPRLISTPMLGGAKTAASGLRMDQAIAESAAMENLEVAATKGAEQIATSGIMQSLTPLQNPALWFLYGAIFALIVYLVWSWAIKKRKK